LCLLQRENKSGVTTEPTESKQGSKLLKIMCLTQDKANLMAININDYSVYT